MFRLETFRLRHQLRIAGQEILDSREDAEWPRRHSVTKGSISGQEGAEQPEGH